MDLSCALTCLLAHEPRDPLVIEEFYKMAQEYFTVSKAKKPKPRNDEEKDMLNFVEIYTLKKKLSWIEPYLFNLTSMPTASRTLV